MQMESKTENGVLVLTLKDHRLDAKVSVEFRNAMSGFIDGGDRVIVLNMEDVEFIDSSGLGALVSSLKQMGPEGKLALCHLNAPVASMFALTRMDRVFTLCTTEAQAIRILSADVHPTRPV
ncbi:MAG: STAS domain-containing protein [Gammaproteobacteria bacterium]